ncbi:hypothetical protein FF38_02756 [Lucilia cuprina]|uniref:Uncharacterized protein n=1 Tax=Lucilia cuprina TaxID=7375 RepID=A0A0L0CQP1_LUCCU|nr:hypothetical protein FF38_02756 [Lucilia cuprina]
MSNVRRKLRVWPNDFVLLSSRKEKEQQQQNNEESDNSNDNNNINTTNSSSNSTIAGSSSVSTLNSSEINSRDTMAAKNKIHVAATKSLDLTGPHDDVYKNNDAANNDDDDDVSGILIRIALLDLKDTLTDRSKQQHESNESKMVIGYLIIS